MAHEHTHILLLIGFFIALFLACKGYDKGGQLTDAVRRRPYSVLLFDEMEKVSFIMAYLFLLLPNSLQLILILTFI